MVLMPFGMHAEAGGRPTTAAATDLFQDILPHLTRINTVLLQTPSLTMPLRYTEGARCCVWIGVMCVVATGHKSVALPSMAVHTGVKAAHRGLLGKKNRLQPQQKAFEDASGPVLMKQHIEAEQLAQQDRTVTYKSILTQLFDLLRMNLRYILHRVLATFFITFLNTTNCKFCLQSPVTQGALKACQCGQSQFKSVFDSTLSPSTG